MIEKWVIFKRDYLEISFLRENCGYDGWDERRRIDLSAEQQLNVSLMKELS